MFCYWNSTFFFFFSFCLGFNNQNFNLIINWSHTGNLVLANHVGKADLMNLCGNSCKILQGKALPLARGFGWWPYGEQGVFKPRVEHGVASQERYWANDSSGENWKASSYFPRLLLAQSGLPQVWNLFFNKIPAFKTDPPSVKAAVQVLLCDSRRPAALSISGRTMSVGGWCTSAKRVSLLSSAFIAVAVCDTV